MYILGKLLVTCDDAAALQLCTRLPRGETHILVSSCWCSSGVRKLYQIRKSPFWHTTAAHQGETHSIKKLGDMHAKAVTVPKDRTSVCTVCTHAAELKHKEAKLFFQIGLKRDEQTLNILLSLVRNGNRASLAIVPRIALNIKNSSQLRCKQRPYTVFVVLPDQGVTQFIQKLKQLWKDSIGQYTPCTLLYRRIYELPSQAQRNQG